MFDNWRAKGIVTRLDEFRQPETLVFFFDGTVRLLEATNNRSVPVSLGESLKLRYNGSEVCLEEGGLNSSPIYEPIGNCIYFIHGHAIMCLDNNNVLTVAAGSMEEEGRTDGRGEEARFIFGAVGSLATDGSGNLFVADDTRICKVSVQDGEAEVTGSAAQPSFSIASLAYEKSSGRLLGVTPSALYCLQPPEECDAELQAELISGEEGLWDGDADAAFYSPWPSMVLDDSGSAYIANRQSRRLWKVDTSDGSVVTVSEDLPIVMQEWKLAVVTPGQLALYSAEELDLPGVEGFEW